MQLLATKYEEFNFSDWLVEYSHQLRRSLSGGVEILGLFVFCADLAEKN